ncbi:MAG: hypothetical protein ACSNEK_06405 [Parachlamydiaceae bacterium]
MSLPVSRSNVATLIPSSETGASPRKGLPPSINENLRRQTNRRSRAFRFVANHMPHSTEKPFFKLAVKTGLMLTEDFDPAMIPTLPPAKIAHLTHAQLAELRIEHLQQFDKKQLLALSPQQLKETGPQAAFILQLLDFQRDASFAIWMNDWVKLGNSDPQFVRSLFRDCGHEITNEFLRMLEREASAEMIVYFYQILKESISLEIKVRQIDEFFLQLGQRIRKGKDRDGQQIIQVEDRDGNTLQLIRSFQKNIFRHLVTDYMMPYLCCPHRDGYGLDVSYSKSELDTKLRNDEVEFVFSTRCALRSHRTHYIVGYVDLSFHANGPVDELMGGNLNCLKTKAHISQVYRLPKIAITEGSHPKRKEGRIRRPRSNLLKVLEAKEKELKSSYNDSLAIDLVLLQLETEAAVMDEVSKLIKVVSREQVTVKELRKALIHRPLAIELIGWLEACFMEKQILDKDLLISAIHTVKAKGMFTSPSAESYYGSGHSYKHRISSHFAWAQDQQAVKEIILQELDNHRNILGSVDQLIKNYRMELKILESGHDARKGEIASPIIKKLRENLKELESKKTYFQANTKAMILENVWRAINEKRIMAENSIASILQLISSHLREIECFKTDLKTAIQQALSKGIKKWDSVDEEDISSAVSQKARSSTVYPLPAEIKKQLKERYAKESPTDSQVSLQDLFDEVLCNVSINHLMKREIKKNPAELDEYIDLLINEAKVTFFGASINFPSRAKRLATIILDRLFISFQEGKV